eukprot:Skav216008  [mRNA]  locus=scaffold833:218355:224330:+ [translate_table: standard]
MSSSSSSFVAFLGGADKYGRWVPEEEIAASAYLGGSTVDFSQALFKYPVITMRSTAFWGSVTVIVPPNVAVEQDGSAILGGFGDTGGIWTNSNTLGASSTNAPVTLRIVGTALMGNVNVAVNHRAKPAQVLSEQEVLTAHTGVPQATAPAAAAPQFTPYAPEAAAPAAPMPTQPAVAATGALQAMD